MTGGLITMVTLVALLVFVLVWHDLAIKYIPLAVAALVAATICGGVLMWLYENLGTIAAVGVSLFIVWTVLGFIGAGLGIQQSDR
jgi:hypothetical protein